MTDVVNATTIPLDVMGKPFSVGQTVVRKGSFYSSGAHTLEVCTVSKISNGKVYLNGSKVPIKFTNTLAIVAEPSM